jgi:hypothetical protein
MDRDKRIFLRISEVPQRLNSLRKVRDLRRDVEERRFSAAGKITAELGLAQVASFAAQQRKTPTAAKAGPTGFPNAALEGPLFYVAK